MIDRGSTVRAGVALGLLVGGFVSTDRALADPPAHHVSEQNRPTLDRLTRLPNARRTARELLEALAGSLSMPLVISPEIPPRSLEKMTQLGLSRSTGAQAVAWTSVVTGLGLSVIDDLLLASAASANRPSLEQLGEMGLNLSPGRPRDLQRAEADVLERISDVDLVDASLAQALIQVGDRYHIDIVADDTLLAGQELVSLKRRDTALKVVLDDLCKQCGARRVWMQSGFFLRAGNTPDLAIRSATPDIHRPKPLAGEGGVLRLKVHNLGLNTLLTHISKLGAMNAKTGSIRHAERGRKVTLEGRGSAAWLIDALVATPPRHVAKSNDAPAVDGDVDARPRPE